MPSHWTYSSFAADAHLEQGDILLPTPELSELFRRTHLHFIDPKYVGFMILTQSCDLVRRNRPCSARYINVGVVRQLDGVLTALLDAVCDPVYTGVYHVDTKLKAKQLLSRLFNQNENSLGLFYLHNDADLKLGKPCVAMEI